METQKIVNLLNNSDNGQYSRGNENDSTIKFETKIIKSNLFDYSDAYILVTGDIKVANVAADTNVAFTNCAENLDIIMPMYNLHEYSDNYADSSGSLYQFKRDKSPINNGNYLNNASDNSTSFKYKASLLEKATDADGKDRSLKNAKIIVPLKYLSNFLRSLEMRLINCKIHLELNWNNNCVIYGADTYAGGDKLIIEKQIFK